jgi:hypothetical protein
MRSMRCTPLIGERVVARQQPIAATRDERASDAAAYALWNFVGQRECSGFRGTEQVLKDYAVPGEVRAKMGVIRAR